ncbi:MAG: class I SAM-dependent rRNA methyltransferase [Planctomycetaceae bacterium]|nr:class I SAM-dependent rRNA methyltransferase [Planctomycetaceae bacterium]
MKKRRSFQGGRMHTNASPTAAESGAAGRQYSRRDNRANERPETSSRDRDRDPTAPSNSQMIRQRTELSPSASQSIPAVMMNRSTLHPLLYRKRLTKIEDARPGDLVAVMAEDRIVGYGVYNPRSEIAVRVLWNTDVFPTDEDWMRKLRDADQLRRGTLKLAESTNAWRLIHSESDGLSGLVVDQFADVLSAEAFGLGMYQRTQLLMPHLCEITGAKHWMVRTSPQFVSQEGCDPPPLSSANCPSQVVIQEFGTRFRVRFEGGHKTGFFCDQRENRRRLADFCEGASVLDLCCYTGGFSVQASVLGKASEVIGVDLDEEPLKVARENANLNQARVRFVQADAFSYMRDMIRNGRLFDVVVLDPPKLIRTRMEIEEGTRRHYALNRLAMQLVRPGGLLLTCSCAGLLQESEFLNLLYAAVRNSNQSEDTDGSTRSSSTPPRTARIIARSGAAPDHPVISNCPETDYLKAVWMIMD